MAFKFIETPIKGLIQIKCEIFNDDRGAFFENFSKKEFEKAGITTEFVQDNQSISKKGVLRGLHFQKNYPQAKIVRVVSGKIYDVAVDLRNNSPTFAKYFGLILDSEKNNMLYISEGFAHGFYVLSDTAIVSYKCSDFYHPEDEDGIIWNDKTLSINWKNECDFINPVLSEKDLNRPVFDKEKIYFNF